MTICDHKKVNAVTVYIGISLVELCDACRRKLCTCERCSAFDRQEDYPGGSCRREPPKLFAPSSELNDWTNEAPYTPCDAWCRDGWRQARPWTAEEAEGWLGDDGDGAPSAGLKCTALGCDEAVVETHYGNLGVVVHFCEPHAQQWREGKPVGASGEPESV